MRATIVIVLGFAQMAFTGLPRTWRLFQQWADFSEPVLGYGLRRTARFWDIEEDRFHEIWLAAFRWLAFAIGVAMVIGGVAFLIQNGWLWDW